MIERTATDPKHPFRTAKTLIFDLEGITVSESLRCWSDLTSLAEYA